MKVIGVYSGKGGVGKSTVASLLALALSKKHAVSLVDLDINTPSVPVLFGGRDTLDNLKIHSVGFTRKGLIDFTGNVLRKVVREQMNKAKDDNSEIVVIDMPPGLDDTHLELVDFMRPSFFVLVVQPNKLSEEDAARTSQLFMKVRVPVAGVIQNMSGDVFGEYTAGQVLGLPLLGTIPLQKDIADLGGKGLVDEIVNPLLDLAETLYEKAGVAEWKLTNKNMFEGSSYSELYDAGLVPSFNDDMKKRESGKRKLWFYGLQSWDEIREMLLDRTIHVHGERDRLLEECDSSRIREMLENLDSENSGIFMVIRPPNTDPQLYPGEIGSAHLYTEHKYHYGVPRIAYQTDNGEVVLFANEVSPISMDRLNAMLESGELVMAQGSKVSRYVPSKETMTAIFNTFGLINDGWEGKYDRLLGADLAEPLPDKTIRVPEREEGEGDYVYGSKIGERDGEGFIPRAKPVEAPVETPKKARKAKSVEKPEIGRYVTITKDDIEQNVCNCESCTEGHRLADYCPVYKKRLLEVYQIGKPVATEYGDVLPVMGGRLPKTVVDHYVDHIAKRLRAVNRKFHDHEMVRPIYNIEELEDERRGLHIAILSNAGFTPLEVSIEACAFKMVVEDYVEQQIRAMGLI